MLGLYDADFGMQDVVLQAGGYTRKDCTVESTVEEGVHSMRDMA